MKKTRQIVGLLALGFLLNSCGQGNNSKDFISEEAVQPQKPIYPSEPEPKKPEADKKKIIRNGQMELKVADLEKTKASIDVAVKTNGGYYADENLRNLDYESSYQLTIRVPSNNFEKLVSDISSIDGEILHKAISASDVTDQFVDLKTRLGNKRSYLSRYRELLKKAQTIKEILEIEEKIRSLEEEIESTEGKLRYLNDQVDYSSLNLRVFKKREFRYRPKERDRFVEKLKQSLSKGWFVFVDFFLFILLLWPFGVIAIVLLFFLRRYQKKRKGNAGNTD